MNFMSCYGYMKSSISTVMLTCHSALVPYCFSKGFFFFETKEGVIDNITMSVKNQINADNLHPEDSLLTRKAVISPIINTLKNHNTNRCVWHVCISLL